MKPVKLNPPILLNKTTTIKSPRTNARVQFCTTQIVHHIPSYSEVETIWWTKEDFQDFKNQSKLLSYETRLEGDKATGGLSDAYNHARFLSLTLENDHVESYSKDVNRYAKLLFSWSARKETCRGLEHWTSRLYWASRNEQLDEARSIIKLTKECNDTPEELAKQYQEYTRPSRIMARMLGEADAYAALQEHEEDAVFFKITRRRSRRS